MTGRVILTAEEMRAAEAAWVAAGTPVETLMERAGIAAAEAIWRFAGPLPALVLCGPGNNGGDGYVIARELAARGLPVRVAALAEAGSDAARAARASWAGPVETLADAEPAQLLIDSLFGTGLARPLDEAVSSRLSDLANAARVRVAIDLPSGIATDDGALLSPVPDYDLTITFQTLKPSHLLQPAARHMGRIVVADIGIDAESDLIEIMRPIVLGPCADDHKYSRGYVAVIGGTLPGAGALAAMAAMRGEVGYVRLCLRQPISDLPLAIVQDARDVEHVLGDERIDAIVIGPGLGTDADAERLLDIALGAGRPLVLDADALTLLSGRDVRSLQRMTHTPILTPHMGEFARLFPAIGGTKVEMARAAAAEAGAVIVLKGADTIISDRVGFATLAAPTSWLATAGTGDVLAGVIASCRRSWRSTEQAASAGVWLHCRAAELAGQGLIADDLIAQLPTALAECL